MSRHIYSPAKNIQVLRFDKRFIEIRRTNDIYLDILQKYVGVAARKKAKMLSLFINISPHRYGPVTLSVVLSDGRIVGSPLNSLHIFLVLSL